MGAMLLCLGAGAIARSEAAAVSPGADVGAAGSTGPVIETNLAGFTLQGRTRLERLVIADLDIVEDVDGRRRLPLLRILQALQVEVTTTGSTVSFRPDGAGEVVLDHVAGTLSDEQGTRPCATLVGLSDLTFESEIYVPDEILPAVLAMEMFWDPLRYAYTFTVDREIAVFRREHGGVGLLSRRDPGAGIQLPSMLPTAGLDRSLAPRIDFLQVNMQSSIITSEGDSEPAGTFAPPRYGLWGHALGGNLTTTVTQKESSPGAGYRIDRVFWNTCYDDVEVALGTSNLGLTELTFPALNLLGLRFNGSVGGASRDRDPSLMGRRETFQQSHVIQGYAPLGSEVTLLINERVVDVQIVQDTDHAPPGEGVYRFDGFNLFVSRLNEVRIVIAAPDGTVEEVEREVLGTDSLIDDGQLAFVGALGGRRLAAVDDFGGEGFFAGGRMNYGLTENLTLSGSAAHQQDLFGADAFRFTGQGETDSLPSQSTHLGSRLIWQVADPLLLTVEGARSETGEMSSADWAYRTNAELHMGRLRLYPAYFRYGPSFFDGQRADLRDVAGGSLSMVWRSPSGDRITFGGSSSRDNLDRERSRTVRIRDTILSWDLRRLIPRSTLTLGTNLVWLDDASPYRYDVIGLDSGLLGGWTLRSRFVIGDDIRRIMREQLPDGTSSRFDRIRRQASNFDARSSLGSGSQSSRFDLRRRLSARWQLSAAYRSTGDTKRSYLDLMRSASYGESWQWRFTPGYDWSDRSLYLQNRLEYLLGGSYRNRVVLENQFLKDDWTVRFSVMVQLNVGFADRKPIPIVDDRLNPDMGGVKGRVFLDYNGNGVPDGGEPGVENVALDTDMGWRISSGKGGLFVIPNSSYRLRARVSLDAENLPAVYTPTHGTQDAIVRSGMFTEVNLGIGAFGSVLGAVRGSTADETIEGVAGLRILLVDGEGNVAGHSITARDGSYYLGEIKPGRYRVRVDQTVLPGGFTLEDAEREVEVFPRDEFFELEGIDFLGKLAELSAPEPAVEQESPSDAQYKIFD
ncbi:hypothetical protein KJ554_03730 [bacterium]|nr:hypothetical protein [bacterium]